MDFYIKPTIRLYTILRMKLSLNIGTFVGIKVYIHSSFLLLLLVYGLLDFSDSGSLTSAIVTVSFILSVFLCVTLHEFGHALTAARFGVKTQNITLYPFGGIAKLEKIPDKPWQELLVAIAGPAVNALIIIVILLAQKLQSGNFPSLLNLRSQMDNFHYLNSLLFVNIMQVMFNMLPAFPMDGGRVLRSVLATFLSYTLATNIAATLGKIMAAVFAMQGLGLAIVPFLPTSPILLFIAFVVWSGAAAEQNFARIKSQFSESSIRALMISNFVSFNETESLGSILKKSKSIRQSDFPIVKDGVVVGLVYASMLNQLTNLPAINYIPASEVMTRAFKSFDAGDKLSVKMSDILSSDQQVFPVTNNGLLVGLLYKNLLLSTNHSNNHPRQYPTN